MSSEKYKLKCNEVGPDIFCIAWDIFQQIRIYHLFLDDIALLLYNTCSQVSIGGNSVNIPGKARALHI